MEQLELRGHWQYRSPSSLSKAEPGTEVKIGWSEFTA